MKHWCTARSMRHVGKESVTGLCWVQVAPNVGLVPGQMTYSSLFTASSLVASSSSSTLKALAVDYKTIGEAGW